MDSLDEFACAHLETLDRRQARRVLAETARLSGVTVRCHGRTLVSFSCNDYLKLSQHPRVKRAAIAAIEAYGTGAGASRLVTGNHPLYRDLEAALARLKGTEAALVFGSGYLANLGVVPALVEAGDLVLIDRLAHSCLFAGTSLSGAKREVFRHNDVGHLAALLERQRGQFRRCLILTERVFSMDGDLAPIADLAPLARRHDAWLMTDDAHGIGILPPSDPADVPLQMGTLSKALGGYGGYLAASAPVVDLMKSRARAFVYTTGLPPATVAAAAEALAVIAEEPELAQRPLANARLFAELVGLDRPESQIVKLVVGASEAALAASASLAEAGFLVAAIRPPTVPAGTARLRFTFTAGHHPEQIRALAAAVAPLIR